MGMKHTQAKTIDRYIKSFPKDIQLSLKQIREIIQKTAPDAVESISYGMPAFKINGKPLVYFAAYEKHIGFYPTPSGTAKFKKELSPYKTGKGSARFPIDEPLPLELIQKIVAFRVQENAKLKK
jgi:uncharacterized protein YdhG (YjbR/CyaY superfamily)